MIWFKEDLENPKLVVYQNWVYHFINPRVFVLNSNRRSNLAFI